MPPKLPVVSGERAIRVMERLGFVRVRQRGSHVVLRKQTSESELICVIPLHKELAEKLDSTAFLQDLTPPKEL